MHWRDLMPILPCDDNYNNVIEWPFLLENAHLQVRSRDKGMHFMNGLFGLLTACNNELTLHSES